MLWQEKIAGGKLTSYWEDGSGLSKTAGNVEGLESVPVHFVRVYKLLLQKL